jgi:PhnB protein
MSNLRPHGHHTITPSFVAKGTSKVIAFMEKAFGARVVDRYEGPDGAVMHAEVMVADSVVMCGEPMAGMEATPAVLTYYTDSVEAVVATYKRALEAGATSINEPKTQPWGYHAASVRDVAGNRWTICTVTEALTHEEIVKRMSGA